MVLTGQAHAKLILFGEHAVVHGFPALGMSLPLLTTVTLSSSDSGSDTSDESSSGVVESLIPFMGTQALHLWQQQTWHVRIDSTIPIGCGLGSSAALCSALSKAIHQALPNPTPQSIWYMAHQAERHFHGHPSGVDTTLSLGDGLLQFQRITPSVLKTSPYETSPFAMVVGVLPRTYKTRDLVANVNQQLESNHDETIKLLKALGNLSTLPPITVQAWCELGKRARLAHDLLRTLGLSTPALDDMIEIGQAAGASGGKLSGAGGGGAFVLFCQEMSCASQVAQVLRQNNAEDLKHLWRFEWNGHQTRIGVES